MSDNHSNNDPNTEKKPVAFTVPLILASVFIFIMVLVLSLCNPKHHGECECKENCSKECMEACEKGDHSKHPTEEAKSEEHKSDTHEAPEKTEVIADSTAK